MTIRTAARIAAGHACIGMTMEQLSIGGPNGAVRVVNGRMDVGVTAVTGLVTIRGTTGCRSVGNVPNIPCS